MRISGFDDPDSSGWDALHRGTEREGFDSPSKFDMSTLSMIMPKRKPSRPQPEMGKAFPIGSGREVIVDAGRHVAPVRRRQDATGGLFEVHHRQRLFGRGQRERGQLRKSRGKQRTSGEKGHEFAAVPRPG